MEIDAKEGLRHLENIEHELGEIKERTNNTKRAFFYGLLYGAGWVVGTVITVASLGWILLFFGIIPGFGAIAEYLNTILNTRIN